MAKPNELTQEEFDAWPDCVVEGCQNKCCLALGSKFCFPHTPGNKHVKSMKIDAFHAEDIETESV